MKSIILLFSLLFSGCTFYSLEVKDNKVCNYNKYFSYACTDNELDYYISATYLLYDYNDEEKRIKELENYEEDEEY